MSRVGTVHTSHSVAQVGTQLPAVDEILVNAVDKLEKTVAEQQERIDTLEEQVEKLTEHAGI